MSDLAPLLQRFFTDRLARQKKASPNTVAAYRDTCRLLLSFARERTGKAPSRLSLADVDATLIGAFLQHLEEDRGNGSATRNARLAAIHSLFSYAAPRAPEHATIISQVLAIPPRRRERSIVSYLTLQETDALLAAPDRATWHGRRDHALILLTVQSGPRVSELTGLASQDAHLGAGPHLRCHGKGRKDQATPLTSQVARMLRTWLAELGPAPNDPLFPTRSGGRLSRDAVERFTLSLRCRVYPEVGPLQDVTLGPNGNVNGLGDKGYSGYSPAVLTPFKGATSPNGNKEANRTHARLRSPGECAMAQLKNWRLLRRLRCCPHRGTAIARAVLVLQLREAR